MPTLKEASSFASDVTFSKPIQLHLGKQHSNVSRFSEKSETIRSPIERPASIREQQDCKLKRFCKSIVSRLKSLLVKYWFLLGLIVVILLAWQFPNVSRKGGYIRAEWSIKWGKIQSRNLIH